MHATLSPDELIDGPHWLCFGFNPPQRQLFFLRATAEEMAGAVFMDQNALDVSRCVGVDLDAVAGQLAERSSPLPG